MRYIYTLDESVFETDTASCLLGAHYLESQYLQELLVKKIKTNLKDETLLPTIHIAYVINQAELIKNCFQYLIESKWKLFHSLENEVISNNLKKIPTEILD